ncbi:MAG: hypothetical protein AAF891_01220 [Pseudomonadota bacterium]
MMRLLLPALALTALAACDPAIPDSGAGVGFDNYNDYQRQQTARDAALQGNALPPPQAVSTEPLSATTSAPLAPTTTAAASVAPATSATAAAEAVLNGTDTQPGVVQASPSNPAPVLRAGGISAENDFGAVSGQRSIEADAALQAQNRSQYQVIQPTALPTRTGAAGPNIVQYALQSNNPRGQRVYQRSGFNAQRKFQRNCAQYASPDQAQQAFLAAGGPQRDKQGLDPDGDGYACAWDPAPFRSAVNG